MYIPRNPKTPPRMAIKRLSGKLTLIPNSLRTICIDIVIRILAEPITAVTDAPILLKPVE